MLGGRRRASYQRTLSAIRIHYAGILRTAFERCDFSLKSAPCPPRAVVQWVFSDWKHRAATHLRLTLWRPNEREVFEAFRQDGINAWNEYQSTGRHVTFEEADTWLAKLELGQDVEPPECHD